MPEQDQTKAIMNTVEGYLEMLQQDLRDARLSGDLNLSAEIEVVITQLKGVSEAREEVNSGVEMCLLRENENALNEIIRLLNEEFTREYRDYIDDLVVSNRLYMGSLSGEAFIDHETGLAIYSLGIVNLITGAIFFFSEII